MKLATISFLTLSLCCAVQAQEQAVPVTIDNFVRAETDNYFRATVDSGGFGKFNHVREPTPVTEQKVIRMNRDTIYSNRVFDLAAGPVTINKPETGRRFQSIQVIDEDHYTPMVVHEPGKFTLTQEEIGTRYVQLVIRTLVDANDPEDVKKANAIQDMVTAEQASQGSFEVPNWDQASLKEIRDAILVLAKTKASSDGAFGARDEVDPITHLLGAAYGWGGNPKSAAIYLNVVPEKNDGRTPHSITVKDVPVSGFWSITVYNKDGFMQENDQSVYSYNNVTAKKNNDGSITINFGRGADTVNNIPITPGWNYVVRLYQPKKEILDGSWKFPEVEVVE